MSKVSKTIDGIYTALKKNLQNGEDVQTSVSHTKQDCLIRREDCESDLEYEALLTLVEVLVQPLGSNMAKTFKPSLRCRLRNFICRRFTAI